MSRSMRGGRGARNDFRGAPYRNRGDFRGGRETPTYGGGGDRLGSSLHRPQRRDYGRGYGNRRPPRGDFNNDFGRRSYVDGRYGQGSRGHFNDRRLPPGDSFSDRRSLLNDRRAFLDQQDFSPPSYGGPTGGYGTSDNFGPTPPGGGYSDNRGYDTAPNYASPGDYCYSYGNGAGGRGSYCPLPQQGKGYLMDNNNQRDITNRNKPSAEELGKEHKKLKPQFNKSSEGTNTSNNEQKRNYSLPSTSKSISKTMDGQPFTTSKEFGENSAAALHESPSGNSGKTSSKRHNENYEKSEGAVDFGRKYEILMCAYYALKLCFDENVTDFKMTTNNKNCGKFDDISLTVTFRDNSTHIFLIQLKHKQNVKEIESENDIKQKEEYLSKYLASFQTTFQTENKQRVNFILLTNIDYKFENKSTYFASTQIKIKNKSTLKFEENFVVSHCEQNNNNLLIIDTVSDDNTVHIFNFTSQNQNNSNCFYLFANQKNCASIGAHIDKLLIEKFECKIDFINFMGLWWEGSFVFTKHDIIAKLAEFLLSPFVQEIPKNINDPLSDKVILLKEAIMQFEMTLVGGFNDAYYVAKIWREDDADLNKIDEFARKYGLTTKKLNDKKDLPSEELTKVLWYLDKVPLIIKYDDKKEKRIGAAIELLSMETDKKKLVLVGQKLEGTFCKWNILENLYDLRKTPICKKVTAAFKVSLQERPSIELEKFINSDTETAKLIEIKDLFLMLEKDLSIGKRLPKLPVAYIPRTLKHHNSSTFEDKAFSAFNNPVNIVIGKPGIGKSTLMTYLSHHCPPDYWCVRVNLIEFDKFFIKKHSTEEITNEFLEDEGTFFNKVRATFRKNKRMYLLLDGLDEIDPNRVETVLAFIKDISSSGIRVWITSREHLKDRVSNYFNISPITIEELTRETQEKYIEQRLCHCDKSEEDEGVNYTQDEAKEIITRLFASVDVAYNLKNILGIPLLLFIITEIFRKDKSNLVEIETEGIFVLTKMYRKFFQGKEEHQNKKAGVQYERALGNYLDIKLKQYELPALETSAPVFLSKLKLNRKKLDESQKFLEKVEKIRDPLGIISQVVGKTNEFQAIFSHQSFAEYFACVWLKKNKEKLRLIKDSFFEDNNENLRLMFDIMLAEDKPLHLAVLLYKNPDQVEKYINHYGDRDEGGRNALHLISSYCDDDRLDGLSDLSDFTPRDLTSFQLLLKECHPLQKDELFEWNCLDYALCRNSLLLFEVILETKLTEEIVDINRIIENFGGFDRLMGSCCLYGYFYLLKTLIDRNVAVNIMNIEVETEDELLITKEVTPLHLASVNGNRDIIELLLKTGCTANVTDELNWTPLHFACRFANYDTVKKIIELGGDLNAVNNKKQTPLHLASINGNTDIIELLSKEGCKINATDRNNWTPLHFACNYGKYDAVMKILELGGDSNAITNKRQTALHLAIEMKNNYIFELLMNKGCHVKWAEEYNWTPLHFACYKGEYDEVKKILELGGDLNTATNQAQTALHLASARGKIEIIELLLKKGYNINVANEHNWTPLHFACRCANYDTVKKIIDLGGDLNAVTNINQTPLHLASENGNPDVIELLLRKRCKINVINKDNWTPLHSACSYGNYDAVIKILELGGDLNAVTNINQTPLHLALKNGNTDIIELLFTKGCQVNVADNNYYTPLHFACNYGKYDVVRKILELGGNLNVVTNDKQTPLHLALKNGNTDVIELLLKKGCQVNVADKDNCTPLHLACWRGNYDAVIKILELDGDLNVVNNDKQTPLHIALRNNNIDISELLLEKRCEINVADKDIYTPLHLACQFGIYNAVIKILELGGDLNAVTNEKQTPLHIASENGKTDIIELLCKKGCEINVADTENYTPLHLACQFGIYNAVIKILEFGGDLNAVTNMKQTPLHIALENGYTDIIKQLLLRTGCKINVTDEESFTPLHLACRLGIYNVVRKILELGGDFNVMTNKKETPLHLASENGNTDIIELLFRKGCKINETDEDNFTPLHFACDNGKYDAVIKILELGGDLNAVTNNKTTSLHLASANGNTDIIRLLLEKGCKINVPNKNNWFPLHYACRWGTYEAVIKILEHGGDLNAVTNKKATSLHLASANGKVDIIELLLEKGCRINVVDEDNWSPLHYGCRWGTYEAVIKILEHGGDLNAVTNKKETPLHLASQKGKTDIIELLFHEGCKINATNKDNWTPLHLACSCGKYDAVIKIVELGGDLNGTTNDKQTALHLASLNTASSKTIDIVKYFCSKNEMNINALNDRSWTPLRCACDKKNYDVIELLLENNAHLDTECRNILSENFYDILCHGKLRLIEILLQRLTNIEITDALSHFPTEFPMYLARKDGHLQPDLLLKMANLISKKHHLKYLVDSSSSDSDSDTESELESDSDSSEDRKSLIEYLVKNFDITEES